jgi:hypothetical protein
MALAVVTVNNPSPAMNTRAQEVALIQRALDLAESAIRGPGGAVASGNIMGDGQVLLGTWTYTAVASS